MIAVKRTADADPMQFEVMVSDQEGESRHRVTMSHATWERLSAGKHQAESCIQAAFRFLLDREPKESILRSFDVTVIAHYFPEFERQLPVYLSRK